MKSLRLIPALLLLSCLSAAHAEPITEMTQDRAAVLEDQRLVGNSRAQAKRRGTIRAVPQLYVYHTDHTAAYHVEGYRDNFIRFLDIAVRKFREERSMVDLDKLLERAHLATATDQTDFEYLTPTDLPTRDLTILFYYTQDCAECQQVEQQLGDWLAANDDLDYNYLRVSLD